MLRRLGGIENAFANPVACELVELAIKFTNKKSTEKALNNIKKILFGAKLAVEDQTFKKLDISDVPVIQVPNWIQSCETACRWIFENHTRPITETLATIGCNDNMVVVNANHAIADAGYLFKILDHCLDDSLPEMPVVPTSLEEGYKKEIDALLAANPNPMVEHLLTRCPADEKDPHLAPEGTKSVYERWDVPASKLSCYNPKEKKVKGLSESMLTGMAMVVGAKANRRDVFGVRLIVDLRRVIDPSRIDWSYACTPSGPNVSFMMRQDQTISDVMAKVKQTIQHMSDNGKAGFLLPAVAKNGFDYPKKDIWPSISNAGAVRIKPPVKDFFVKTSSTSVGMDGSFFVFGYSKVNADQNTLVTQMRYSPAHMSVNCATVLWESYKHFLTEVPLDTKVSDAFDYLQSYQEMIARTN